MNLEKKTTCEESMILAQRRRVYMATPLTPETEKILIKNLLQLLDHRCKLADVLFKAQDVLNSDAKERAENDIQYINEKIKQLLHIE